ncbi:MAG: IPT/TIG domain-containing protein [Candidatus Riflebacteria bacterium]|nr:IPT/TIG domain-containing protein [Candidatus Riflebacteria bacterium]
MRIIKTRPRLAAMMAIFLGLFLVCGYFVAKRILRPPPPSQMKAVPIPADVTKMGDSILAVYGNELVPSSDRDPVVTDVQPREGPPNTVVTVTGTGFGDKQGFSAVMLNLTEAIPQVEMLEWTDTKIQFVVPEHCTTGDVTVIRWDYLRTEMAPKGFFRLVAKNPRPSNGIPFTVLGQEERIKLGKALFFGWTQQNEEASSLLRIPRAKIGLDPYKFQKYGFLPRKDGAAEVDEGEAERFSKPTVVVGVRVKRGLDGEIRVGYSCAYCHTGRDPATGKIEAGLPSSTLQFGKLIALADNLEPDVRAQANRWPAGTADLSFRYFPDGVENPTAIMLARGMHGLRFWSSGGMAMPEYQRHSNAWLMQGSPYMAPLKVSLALCTYLTTLKPVKNPKVDRARAKRGEALFDSYRCNACHTPMLGMYTNQRVFPFDAMGSNSPPTARMKETGGIRTAPLTSIYATAPYLHDQTCATLDDLMNPARLVPGSPLHVKPFTPAPAHPFVVTDPEHRRDLVEFMNSL